MVININNLVEGGRNSDMGAVKKDLSYLPSEVGVRMKSFSNKEGCRISEILTPNQTIEYLNKKSLRETRVKISKETGYRNQLLREVRLLTRGRPTEYLYYYVVNGYKSKL